MSMDPIEAAQAVVDGAGRLREVVPDTMRGFVGLGASTSKAGALEPRFKELLALAISIAVRCEGCLAYHAKAARDRGASRDEVAEAIAVAIYMGGGPSMVYGAEALKAYDAFAGG